MSTLNDLFKEVYSGKIDALIHRGNPFMNLIDVEFFLRNTLLYDFYLENKPK